MNRPVSVFALVGCLAAVGVPLPAQEVREREATELRRTLVAWLECEECEGELEALVRYGDRVVPSLASVLRSGASPASRAIVVNDLTRRYERLAGAGSLPKSRPSRDEFVHAYLANFERLVRSRAAIALGAIGGPRSIEALRDELERRPERELREVIVTALRRAEEPSAGR